MSGQRAPYNAANGIALSDLSTELRLLSIQMQRVGAAIRYFGGFGPFGEYGALLEDQSASVAASLAEQMERMRGEGHA